MRQHGRCLRTYVYGPPYELNEGADIGPSAKRPAHASTITAPTVVDSLERAYRKVTSPTPRRPAVERLVKHCFITAAAYLRLHTSSRLLPEVPDGPDKPEDQRALQVIGRLFKRDGHQRFSYLQERVAAVSGERRVPLRSRLRRAVIAEADQMVREAYAAAQPLAPLLEEVLSTRAGQLDIDDFSLPEPPAPEAGQSRHPTRPRMPQQLLQWHVEQQLGADSFDAFLTSTATQLCQQTLYRPAWSPPRVALALHSLAVARADDELGDWPVPLLIVADAAIFAAAQEVLSLDGGLKAPGGSPAGVAEELAGRLRHVWPLLRDGHAEVPTLAALAPATVARLTRRAEQLLTGKL